MDMRKLRCARQETKPYNRQRDLAWLLGIMPDASLETHVIVNRLEEALTRQKRAAWRQSMHYDINRHIRLLQALKTERAMARSGHRP